MRFLLLLPSGSRVRIAHDSGRGAALPGLYSGSFYSVSSMNTWPGTSIPKSAVKCGEEKPITTFKSSGKCGACRYQEQLMRKRHGGAYSRAGTK